MYPTGACFVQELDDLIHLTFLDLVPTCLAQNVVYHPPTHIEGLWFRHECWNWNCPSSLKKVKRRNIFSQLVHRLSMALSGNMMSKLVHNSQDDTQFSLLIFHIRDALISYYWYNHIFLLKLSNVRGFFLFNFWTHASSSHIFFSQAFPHWDLYGDTMILSPYFVSLVFSLVPMFSTKGSFYMQFPSSYLSSLKKEKEEEHLLAAGPQTVNGFIWKYDE